MNTGDIKQPSVVYIGEIPLQSEDGMPRLWEKEVDELEELHRKGCDVAGWRDQDGSTLLHLAARETEKTDFLCSIGADVTIRDVEGRTPLHMAAIAGSISTALIHIRKGADINAKDDSGKTPLDYAKEKGIGFLDKHRILVGFGEEMIPEYYSNWFLNQAHLITSRISENVSKTAKRMIDLLIIHSFGKAANLSESTSKNIGLQGSPVLRKGGIYHRSVRSGLDHYISNILSWKLSVQPSQVFLVDSPLLEKALCRDFDKAGPISTVDDIKKLISSPLLNQNSSKPVLIDCTPFYRKGELHERVQLFWETVSSEKVYNIVPFGFIQYQGENILFLDDKQTRWDFNNTIESIIRKNGFVLSPDRQKKAILKLAALEDVLDNFAIPMVAPYKHEGLIPRVFDSFEDFLTHPALERFRQLSESNDAPPYLKILPEATVALLRGFRQSRVDQAFKKEGLSELLQLSYFKILNSIAMAAYRRNDIIKFMNEIELIHQQIQNILGILSLNNGYDETEFEAHALGKLTSGKNPVIPPEIKTARIHLKASAMRCLSSALSAVEEQKGTCKLHVALLKDSYYQETGFFADMKNYDISQLDGDRFSVDKDSAFGQKVEDPVDLCILEFRHNFTKGRRVYKTEDVKGQLLYMHEKGLLADKCTAVIDNTIDLECSAGIRDILHDPKIRDLIDEGRLNIVFIRSGQKFDMFGLDNYYAGVATIINNRKSFEKFNAFMELPDDCLRGLSYQGMTHLQVCGDRDKYRLAIMENTKKIYDMLPPEMIANEIEPKLFEIGKIDDDRQVFLDIKVGEDQDLLYAIARKICQMARKAKIPLLTKPSFSFPITNITIMGSKLRINPGLEGEENLRFFAECLMKLHKHVDLIARDASLSKDDKVFAMTEAISKYEVDRKSDD